MISLCISFLLSSFPFSIFEVGSPVAQLDSQGSYMLNNMSYSKGTLVIDSLTHTASPSKGTLNLNSLSGRRQDSIFNSLTFNQDDSDFPEEYKHRSTHSASFGLRKQRTNMSHSTYNSIMLSEELNDTDDANSVIADVVIIDNFVSDTLTLKELWNNFSRENPDRLEK